MREEHDVRLVVVQSEEDAAHDKDVFTIDFREIFRSFKRASVRWLALAVALGCIAFGAAIGYHDFFQNGDAVALIGFTYEGARTGLDPAGGTLDVTKIASPVVVKEAVDALGIPVRLDDVRSAIEVTGVIPDDAYEQLTLYYDVFSSTNNIQAVQSLMETERTGTEYIISLDPGQAGVSREDSIVLLDGVLEAYRRYFETTYHPHDDLGSAVNVIDYRDYDYAEAVSIFTSALDQIGSYLDSVARTDSRGFRSTQTGYSFSDLSRTVELVRETDLERASSYVMVNHVTSRDLDDQTAYYTWRIRELQQLRAVQQTKLEALNGSIASYEKDPVLFTIGEGSAMIQQSADGGAYDSMIREKLATQQRISAYGRTIAYYEEIVAGFQESGPISEDDIRKVESYLESLEKRVDALVSAVVATTDEYYDRAAFDDTVQILIPAAIQGAGRSTAGSIVLFVGATEAALFACFCMYAVASGLRRSYMNYMEWRLRTVERHDGEGDAGDPGED